jgi:AcrR family transcriptional regulator
MSSLSHSAGPSPEPRWHRRKEARPAEILDAALHEFVARGYAATRLDDIAKRAGCTKGTIFLYFPNKAELFKALIRETVIPLIQQAEQVVEQHEGPVRDLLAKIIRSRWESLVHSRLSGLPKLIFAEAVNFPELARFYHDEVIARSQAVMQRVLRLGIERGEFRDVDVAGVARLAVSPMLVATLWKHSFALCAPTQVDAQAYFETSLDILLRGIAREAPSEGVS